MNDLPVNPLPTLADEIAAYLPFLVPHHADGVVPLRALAEALGVDWPRVRTAAQELDGTGRCRLLLRKRVLHLVQPDYAGRICIICHREFAAVKKETRTCSHSCGRHLAWRNPVMRERHRASVIAARSSPSARERMSKIQKARCNTPEERKRRSDCNRRSWKDPESRAKRLIAIEDAWKGDKAKARIERARNKKLSLWSDPAWKAKTVEAMRNGTRGRNQRAVIALVQGDPNIEAMEVAAKVGLTLEQVKTLWRRCARLGLIARKPKDDRRGSTQTTDPVAKRAASRRANRQAQAGRDHHA